MTNARLLFVLALSGCLADAQAEIVPTRPPTPLERTGSASQKFGFVFAAEGTTFSGLDASGDDLCWPDLTQIVVSCSTQQMACWVEADADDITLTLATMTIDDAETVYAGDGRGACARIEAGSYRSMVLDRGLFSASTMVGRRTRSCSGSTYAGMPCHADTDCPGAPSICLPVATSAKTCARLFTSSADCAGVVE